MADNNKKPKYIIVTGGVLSGLGKGIVTSSIGKLLQMQGYCVTAIKIDPYINIDAGTIRPTEHGEVFVTEDGGEIDQDLGNYERFLNINLHKDHNITTGQVYLEVITKERAGKYLGQDVEVMPHIPEEIKRRIRATAKRMGVDFTLVEIGGTVGDYQNILFMEAARQMKLDGDEVVFVHVVYLPIPKNIGEMKTKPAQHSIIKANSLGIHPDFIIGRAEKPLDEPRKKTISFTCSIKPDRIFSAPDLESIYEEPLVFAEQELDKEILKKFNLPYKHNGELKEWKKFIEKIKSPKKEVKVGIVGKYFDTGDFSLEDSYISVIEAVKHACINNNVKAKIQWINSKDFEKDPKSVSKLKEVDALIVPGGFGNSGVEGKILAIKYARENNLPYLGLCYGMQLAVCEFARNVCGMTGAISTEINKDTKYPIIDILPEQIDKLKLNDYGATMRLGEYPAVLKEGTKTFDLYGQKEVSERHRHRYEVNPEYIPKLEEKGLVFSGKSPDRKLMEFIELPDHKFFVGTQGHPEFKSRPLKGHPLFVGLIKAALE
jgi:CTP synthase